MGVRCSFVGLLVLSGVFSVVREWVVLTSLVGLMVVLKLASSRCPCGCAMGSVEVEVGSCQC